MRFHCLKSLIFPWIYRADWTLHRRMECIKWSFLHSVQCITWHYTWTKYPKSTTFPYSSSAKPFQSHQIVCSLHWTTEALQLVQNCFLFVYAFHIFIIKTSTTFEINTISQTNYTDQHASKRIFQCCDALIKQQQQRKRQPDDEIHSLIDVSIKCVECEMIEWNYQSRTIAILKKKRKTWALGGYTDIERATIKVSFCV